MKHILLVLMAFFAVTTASAQPGNWRERDRQLDPEIREALRDYCRIMQIRAERNRAIQVPRVCYRLFPGTYQPPWRRPQ
jgi:hypothetical protein